MSVVRELKGWPHVFTTTSGKSFRVLPNEEKRISDKEVSEDMRTAVKMKLISITEESYKAVSAVKEHRKNAAPKKSKN